MKILQFVLSCSLQSDGQTDLTKLIAAFSIFAKAPNKKIYSLAATQEGHRKRTDLLGGHKMNMYAFLSECHVTLNTHFYKKII
jgi:hypothetical protein